MTGDLVPSSIKNFLLYVTPDGDVRVEILLHNKNLWLTQAQIALLFDLDRSVVTKHLKNIYAEQELIKGATCAFFAQVQTEGDRTVTRQVEFYNLDAIISVGYRVNSEATAYFKQWVTQELVTHSPLEGWRGATGWGGSETVRLNSGQTTLDSGQAPLDLGQTTPSDSVCHPFGEGELTPYQLPFNLKLKERARALRKAENLAEVIFWNHVKNKQFCDLDFDRQKIIGNYIVDFYCRRLALVIEIDGDSHVGKEEYDELRDAYLKGLDLHIIHYTDIDIKTNIQSVLTHLKATLQKLPERSSPKIPLLRRGGRRKTGQSKNSPSPKGWQTESDGVVNSRYRSNQAQNESSDFDRMATKVVGRLAGAKDKLPRLSTTATPSGKGNLKG